MTRTRSTALILSVLMIGSVLSLGAAPVAAQPAPTISDNGGSGTPGGTTTVSYTVDNTGSTAANALIEFPSLPSELSIASTSGDVSNELLGSTPPGVITTSVSAGGSATVDVTFNIASSASGSSVSTGAVDVSMTSGGSTFTDSTTTSISLSTGSTPPGSSNPTDPANTNEGSSYISDDTPDVGFADNTDLSGSTVWQGQEIVVDLSNVVSGETEVQLQRVESFGTDGSATLAQQLTTNSNGILTIDTEDQETGDYFLTGSASITSGSPALPTTSYAL